MVNDSLDGFPEIIASLAQKEIDLCQNQEQLLAVRKKWDRYLKALNKHLAGKGPMPYFDEKGEVQYGD